MCIVTKTFEPHCLFIGEPEGDAWASAPIPGKGAVGKKDSSEYITHVKKKKRRKCGSSFFFYLHAPPSLGFPHLLAVKEYEQIRRFLPINCCLTALANGPVFLYLAFKPLPSLQAIPSLTEDLTTFLPHHGLEDGSACWS